MIHGLDNLAAAVGIAALLLGRSSANPAAAADAPWPRHTIDRASRGADGTRLADANGDGLLDIATGWEEGGVIRVCLNPGKAKVKETWPAVTVGQVASPEDAVLVDLDGDGAVDVVSSCEGKNRTMYVHWAPKDKARYLSAEAWTTQAIPATADQQMWMYCLPMQIDGRHGVDLVVGSKGAGACVGWLEAPENPRDLKAWRLHRLRDAGWIMSLIPADMDGDGRDDILFSDRKGKASGVYWLQSPPHESAAKSDAWREHAIGAVGEETMFIARDKLPGESSPSIFAAVKKDERIDRLLLPAGRDAKARSISFRGDTKRFGGVKAVRAGDLRGDGKTSVVVSCEGASGAKSGVYYFDLPAGDEAPRFVDIGGAEGVKYDRVELIDLDGDGDLDVLTCEEADNLGVVWYENPAK